MPLVKEMGNIAESVVSSYEARIQGMEAILDATYSSLQCFPDSLRDTRQEREKINAEFREKLAKNKSLRKKDFDNMMQGILSAQDEREKEVRKLLSGYLNELRRMSQVLREDLGKFKDSLAKGEAFRVKEFKESIKEVLAKQNERKEDAISKLKEFQKEQQEMTKRLKELSDKGKEVRIKELKSMLKEFQAPYRNRIACQERRSEEVSTMLEGFKKERTEAGKKWRRERR